MSKADYNRYILGVIEDVISGLGLRSELKCQLGVVLDVGRPDGFILRKYSGGLCGAEETKKPSLGTDKSILMDPTIVGQLFDYLMDMRHYYGVRYAFGILSSYEEWRIIWLNDADDAAQATSEDFFNSSRGFNLPSMREQIPTEIPVHNDISSTFQSISYEKLDSSKRACFATKIYKWNDKNLPYLLASVVKKMYLSPIIIPPLFSSDRYLEVMTPKASSWKKPKLKTFNLGIIPSSEKKELINIVLLGNGSEGRACLACDYHGNCCVVKFYMKDQIKKEKMNIEKEAEYWKIFWGLEARVDIFKSENVLLMPYVKTYSNFEKLKQEVTIKQLMEAAHRISSLNYCYNDIRMENIGCYKDNNGKIHAIFIDLSPLYIKTMNSAESFIKMEENIKKIYST